MKPGQDSRPSVPAATPNREAVSARMFETVCGDVHVSAMPVRGVCAQVEVEKGWDGLGGRYVPVHCAARSLALLGELPTPSHLT